MVVATIASAGAIRGGGGGGIGGLGSSNLQRFEAYDPLALKGRGTRWWRVIVFD